MRLHRSNPLLNEAIEALDQRLHQAKRQLPKATLEEMIALAWKLLTPLELDFVREELARCVESRTYYLENYHVIQPEQGILTCLSPLYDHQWMVENALAREINDSGQSRIIVLKPRQAGITEYASGVMCWRTFFVPHAYTISVAQAPDVAAHIQRKINITYDHLTWWMRPERQYHSKGEYLEFNRKSVDERSSDPGLGSVFVTTHAQRTTGVAIGRTVRSLHMSEVSRWPSGEVFTGDIEPSMNATDTVGIAESTALGSDGFYYNLWQEAMEGESDWTPVFLPVYRARKFSLPLKPSQRPFILTEIEQAARDRVEREEKFTITDEFFNWRRRRIKSAVARTGFPYAHYESYPMTPREAFQSSGLCAFPRHKLDEQGQAHVRKPLWVGEIIFQGLNAAPKLLLNHMLTPDGGYLDVALEKREYHNRLYLWEQPEPDEVYYLASDVGDGNGGDFSVCEIFRAGSGNNPDVQVGEWVGYEQPEAFARICYALGHYFNRCEIAVEYAKEGQTTANYLMNDLEYPNLYRPRHRDRAKGQLAAYMHWQTTGKTKPLIMAKMSESLLDDTIIIRSQYLLDELYKAVKEGSAFEGLDSHDDAAVAATICLFCLRETLPELRPMGGSDDAADTAPTWGSRASGGATIYGVYDEFFRLRAQTRDLKSAESQLARNPAWKIKPIMVSKANTAYSPIHHGSGLESRMYRNYGMDPWGMTPSVVSAFRDMTEGRGAQAPLGGREGLTVAQMNSMLSGDDGEVGWD